MNPPSELRTERLLLRRWRVTDRDPYAAMNAHPVVMEHFPNLLSRTESDEHVDRIEARFEDRGFSLWAVEVLGGAPFIGFVGLNVPYFDAHFTPAVEVGWRLAREHWGQGYASEAAAVSLDDGFTRLGVDEIVSFTTTRNERSQRVMQRLGMTYDAADDFEHPNLPVDHPQRRHLLDRLRADDWRARRVPRNR